jgi:hypothetical protein
MQKQFRAIMTLDTFDPPREEKGREGVELTKRKVGKEWS